MRKGQRWSKDKIKTYDVYDLKKGEKYVGEYSQEELARNLYTTVNSIKSAISHAKKRGNERIILRYRYELVEVNDEEHDYRFE